MSKLRWQRTQGVAFPLDTLSPEAVERNFETICDFEKDPAYPTSMQDSIGIMMGNLSNRSAETEGAAASTSSGADSGAFSAAATVFNTLAERVKADGASLVKVCIMMYLNPLSLSLSLSLELSLFELLLNS
jgi:hypothetical protein